MKRILVGIPTLNEANNVGQMVARLEKLALPLDILFVDDNSGDGTGGILDELARMKPSVRVMHRPAALGIGSAHQAILEYAYHHQYETLVTMDCDFSHQPEDIPRLLAIDPIIPIAVGSRFLDHRSLEDWNIKRKFLTHLGHGLTLRLLRLPMDATGAFRLYRLDQIPKKLWAEVKSRGYAFFFESLLVLKKSGFQCAEISIRLPKRVYGESKLSLRQALRSLGVLLRLFLGARGFCGASNDAKGWDHYWKAGHSGERRWYAVVASLYRRIFIVDRLRDVLDRHFVPGATLYHVGSGGGEVDEQASKKFKITAVDISPEARKLYALRYPGATVLSGDILHGPMVKPLAGLYSLGLVEHFSREEIVRILSHMRQSILSRGKIILFWPCRHAPSVYFLRFVAGIRGLCGILSPLHPPEPSLLRSRAEAQEIASEAGCRLVEYDYGPRDLWIQAVMVLEGEDRDGQKPEPLRFEK